MPRTGRIVLPHYPHHIVQRGHNRQVVFAEPADYERYLSDLRELKEALGIKVYAYCLKIKGDENQRGQIYFCAPTSKASTQIAAISPDRNNLK